jgi:DNA-binding CsgD family transcriptional regulator
MASQADRAHVRLAELVAALSLGIDLGFGQPMEHVLRQCLIALRLAERLGLDEEQRAVVYYTALLINVGCHSDAHEQAKWFGDDIAMKAGKYDHDFRSVRSALAGLRMLGAGRSPLQRLQIALEFALSGHREVDTMIAQHAEMATMLAADLELPPEVQDGLGSSYERWDGRGWPGELGGEDVPVASRLAQAAEFFEVANRVGGVAAARELARERRGEQFRPRRLRPHRVRRGGHPVGTGHGRHLGRTSPSASCASPTSSRRSPPSRSNTGSGWTARAIREGCRARVSLSSPASSAPPTPTRPCANRGPTGWSAQPRTPRGELRADVKAGRLDADAVEAVLGAAGHRVHRRRDGPAGLTQREVEVLQLVARGLSNKEIAERLVISPKTVGNHVEHIYGKIECSNRAAAGLFAMRHGLLPEQEFLAPVPA